MTVNQNGELNLHIRWDYFISLPDDMYRPLDNYLTVVKREFLLKAEKQSFQEYLFSHMQTMHNIGEKLLQSCSVFSGSLLQQYSIKSNFKS